MSQRLDGCDHLVAFEDVKKFMSDCIISAGAVEEHAVQLTQVLFAADYRGHYSHGLNRLDMYIHDLEAALCKGEGKPTICKEKASVAWVDGQHLLGPVVANFCMDIAVRKASETGIGWVTAKNSNHFGIAGYYAINALQRGKIGMAFTNTSPVLFATRSRELMLGTNPISLVAPGIGEDNFALDMATSTVAAGKIEIADRREEAIPNAWAADKGGIETNDPKKVINGGGLLPLGGMEETGGYKGYGLCTMVEIFCGIMAGSGWGPRIRRWKETNRQANLGQCFVAIDPEAFAPGFPERLQELLNALRNAEPIDKEKPVLVAGDPERMRMKLCDQLGGIPYHANQYKFMREIGKRQKVAVPKAKKIQMSS